jgi:hypothetical protein
MDSTTATRARTDPRTDPGIAILHAGIVGLTLTTAAIHASLGGPLFTLNAIGYAGFALLMVLPGRIGDLRWLVRLALLGFTCLTIGGWILFGARFGLAYVDKGVEVVLVLALAIDLWLEDGGPAGILHRSRALVAAGLARTGVWPR